jgi:PHD/YefM family antitoxin component YafN of YafNO toxin-antitoxin module
MAKTLDIKEARAIYGPDLPSPEEVAEGPVIIRREGKPYAVAIPLDDYHRFQEWREKAEREVQTQAQDKALRQPFDRAQDKAQDEAWEKERAAFHRLKPQLLQTHKGLYVAIHGGQVVDADTDNLALAQRAMSKLRGKPFYLQLVSEEPRTFEVPSPEGLYSV